MKTNLNAGGSRIRCGWSFLTPQCAFKLPFYWPLRFLWICILFTASVSAAELRIERLQATGADTTPFATVEVHFNKPVQDGTFTLDDIVTFSGSGLPAVISVTKTSSTNYLLTCTGTGLQAYTLEIGPNILDDEGDPLDQDGDGTPGEVADDVFRARLIADNSTITSADTSQEGRHLLFARGAAVVQGNHSFARVEAQRAATPLFEQAVTLTFQSVRVEGAGASLRVGGGAVVSVLETVMVVDGSELRLKSKDNTGQVGGQWVGVGVTLNAANVTVDATSKITADGEGYTFGQGPGGSPSHVIGAAHGGLGQENPALPYGDPFEPVDLGSAGGAMAGVFGGGAIRLIVTGTLTLDGEITADGTNINNNVSSGAGGSIWATVGTLAGGGKFTADGSIQNKASSGGRVAVYYSVDGGFGGFLTSTSNPGGSAAEKGTLIFVDTSVEGHHLRFPQRFVMADDANLNVATIIVENGGLLEIGGASTITTTGAFDVIGASTVLVKSKNKSAQVGGEWVGRGATIHAANLTVAAGSKIDADRQGYTTGQGPGGTSNHGIGAAHGGFGELNPALPYGDPFEPVELGSAAGTAGGAAFGGGAIRLIVEGTLTLNGEVTADGGNTTGNVSSGAGGSIWATVGTLTGNGKFTVNGSDHNAASSGGRIAVYYTDANGFNGFLTTSVNPGESAAEKGTLLFIDTSVPGNRARISQRMVFAPDSTTTFGEVLIDNGARVEIGGGATLQVTNTLMLVENSTLFAQSKNKSAKVGAEWLGRGVTIQSNELIIEAGSKIDADRQGYTTGQGPGGTSNHGHGAAHGGFGELNPALPYGDPYEPIELGSAGGTAGGSAFGGGAIRLIVDGTLTLNGEVTADGGNTTGNVSSGSGGSIWATVGTLTGNGKFTADGSAGASAGNGQSAGGRIAVYYVTNAGFGGFLTSTVNTGGSTAEKGTLLFIDTSIPGNRVRISQRMAFDQDSVTTFGELTVDNGARVEIGGGSLLQVTGTLAVTENSTVFAQSKNKTAKVGDVWLGRGITIQANHLDIEAGSKIDADQQGYTTGLGPGGTSSHIIGAAHGGFGGLNPALPYGDPFEPIELGSAGGTAGGSAFGGGAIRLIVSGTLTINGEVTADGGNTTGNVSSGSGGSIWATVGTLAGSGKFTADGSSGALVGNGQSAGGRIAVYYATDAGFGGFLTSTVNTGGSTAEKGTLLFIDTSIPGNRVRVSQRMAFDQDSTTTFGELTIDNGARIIIGGGAILQVTGALEVVEGSSIVAQSKNNTGKVAGEWVGRGITIQAGDLFIEAGSKIDADRQGYTFAQGPGGNPSHLAGAAHGGLGSFHSFSFLSTPYGDPYEPVDLGSAGGAAAGIFGGGAVRLIVTGTLTLDGEITADGFNINSNLSSGSGGSIWATTGTLAGSGKFTADGSSGGGPGNGKSAGGRIAVYYSVDAGFGGFLSSSVNGGGTNPDGSTAEAGTLIFLDMSEGLPAAARVSQRFKVEQDTSAAFRSLNVDDAALLELGGGSTLGVSGQFQVSGNSVVKMRAKDNRATVGAIWAGAGPVIVAHMLTVENGSRIDADGEGYGHAQGPGAGLSNLDGASHGGLGGHQSIVIPPFTYGNPLQPVTLGSGGGGSGTSFGGGAIKLIVSGALAVNGSISANAATGGGNRSGASGGSVWIIANTVSGSGTIQAHGESLPGMGGNRAGGGGRIAIYTAGSLSLPAGNITASPGPGNTAVLATAGTVHTSNDVPPFLLVQPAALGVHDTAPVQWIAFGDDTSALRAQVVTACNGASFPLAADQPANGSLGWDTTKTPDGLHELRVVFRNAGGLFVGEAKKNLFVNNAAVWHGGVLTSSETWQAGVMHIVEADVTIPNGVTLAIQAGAVVKFMPFRRLIVTDGGVVNASAATMAQPIVLTSLFDDSAGGDTNFDQNRTLPRPGDWGGVTVTGTGSFLFNAFVERRYSLDIHSGTLGASQTWTRNTLHVITSDVTVPNGVTLTVNPGAVVKFHPDRKLIIQNGGVLHAPGTYALPIAFTSILDDAHGGDSNRDGNLTSPVAGNWQQLLISGSATMSHCHVLYGGGQSAVDGMIRQQGGGSSLTFRNGIIDQALFDGFHLRDGPSLIENSIILRADRGISAQPGSTAQAVNCTVHACREGLNPHGGSFTIVNCLVTGSGQFGINRDFGGEPTISFSNVFGSATANYAGFTNQTGIDGNLSVDPKYRNADQDDFRLKFASPVIDAADGAQAPETDLTGAPRYDDPRTPNTGTATTTSVFADMGAQEFVEPSQMASNLDLAVDSVTGPAFAIAGETVEVSWIIRNAGSAAITGPWFDTVAIRAAGGSNQPVFAGEVEIGDGVLLGPGQSFSATAQLRVPGAVLGRYNWLVVTNSRGTVFEGANTDNNTAVSAALFDLDLEELIPNAPPLNRFFIAPGQPHWFKILPPAGSQIKVLLDLNGTGVTEIYTARGMMPTRELHDRKHAEFASADTTIIIPGASGQPWYVLAWPGLLDTSPQSFDISAQSEVFALNRISVSTATASGNLTIGFFGSLLSGAATYELAGPGGTLTATSVHPGDGSRASATFNLDGVAPGSYTARVTIGGQSVELQNAITIGSSTPAALIASEQIQVRLIAPPAVREGRKSSVVVEVKNISNRDVYVPILRVTVEGWSATPSPQIEGVQFASTQSAGSRQVVTIIEVPYIPPLRHNRVREKFLVFPLNPEDPAGILPPGFTSQIVLEGIPDITSDEIEIYIEDMIPEKALNFALIKDQSRPPDMPQQAWDVIFGNFASALGGNTTQAIRQLAENATYLSRVGRRPEGIADVVKWELAKAGVFDEIQKRWTLGPLGYGSWPLAPTASVTGIGSGDSLPTFTLFTSPGKRRQFVLLPGADDFTGPAAETAVVKESAPETFEVCDKDGSSLIFIPVVSGDLSSLRLVSMRAPNGAVGTFSYDAEGRLTGFAREGRSVACTYNAAGRISTLTDPHGRVTIFGYDAANEHLTSITAPNGLVASISYYTGEGMHKEHAQKRISLSDGLQVDYEFDDRGRLSRIAKNNGSEPVVITYDNQTGIKLTDALGAAERMELDDAARIVRFTPAGLLALEMRRNSYGTLTALGAPDAGVLHLLIPNLDGLPAVEIDPLGNRATTTYDPETSQVISYTDFTGATTMVGYHKDNDRLAIGSITLADGSAMNMNYDAQGRLVDFTNARGQTAEFSYDGLGRVVQRVIPGGIADTFEYSGSSFQPESITRTEGGDDKTTRFYYHSTGNVSRIEFPNGKALNYTYDTAGRKASVVSDDGYHAAYEYNEVGRLRFVRDGLSNVLAEYEYDAAGRTRARIMSGGVRTEYDYSPGGQITSIVTKRGDQTLVESFHYDHDALGRIIGAVTPQGEFEFEYDLKSRLVKIHAPGPRTLQYQYDEEGNRVKVIDDGVEQNYSASALHAYLTAAGLTFSHDADGNLITRQGQGGTATFAYGPDSRLTGTEDATGSWSYEYDALGNLCAITRNGDRTELLVDPLGQGDILAEYGSAGTTRYFHGNGLVAQTAPGGLSSFLFDGSGHVSALIDATGDVQNTYSWLPFGEAFASPQETVETRFKFSGAYGGISAGGGMVLMRSRGYDPRLGRFLSRDRAYLPFGNMYAYCSNNPVGRFDRHGEDGEWYDAAWSDPATAASNSGLIADGISGVLGAIERGGGMAAAKGGSDFLANTAGRAGSASNIVGKAGAAGNVILATQELWNNMTSPPKDANFAGFEAVNAVATFGLKLVTANLPFVGTGIDITKAFVDQASADIFNHSFNMYYEEASSPENIFSEDALYRLRNGGKMRVVRSYDPNDITGPVGFGPEMWVDDEGAMHFTVRFENLASASAAAYRVVVTLPLDPNFDWSTFELEEAGAAGSVVYLPRGRQQYTTRFDVKTDPNPVKVSAVLNPSTGMVTWIFESFDNFTGQLPEDPLAGFLPPNNAEGDGEGFVKFLIRPKTGLVDPFTLSAQASIVFDTNEAIDTNIHSNRIETGTPAAAIVSLPATVPLGRGGFLVRWGGSGSFSGIAGYDVYVSDNGGPWTLWLENTRLRSAIYPGVAGRTYAFFVLARDNVGQLSAVPVEADTQSVVAERPFFLNKSYMGRLWFEDDERQLEGRVNATVSRTGVISGTVRVNGRVLSFKGKLDTDNKITVSLKNTDPPLEVRLHHYHGSTSAEVAGILATQESVAEVDAFEAPFRCVRNVWHSRNNPCPAAGRFTLLLEPNDGGVNALTVPGFSTLTVSKTGASRFAGRTGVNHAFSASTTLNEYGEAPIYIILSNKRGILSGTPDLSAMPDVNAFAGVFSWTKALTLTTLELQHAMSMTGSRYVKTNPAIPLADATGVITLDEGGLDTPLTNTFSFTTKGAILADSTHPQKIKATLNQTTGGLSGSFKYPGTNTTVTLRGVLLQTQQQGAGFFIPKNQPPGWFTVTD